MFMNHSADLRLLLRHPVYIFNFVETFKLPCNEMWKFLDPGARGDGHLQQYVQHQVQQNQRLREKYKIDV